MSLVGCKRKEITIAEIGVYKGDNAMSMLTVADNIKRMYLVDTFAPNYKWFTDETGAPFTEEKAEEFVDKVKERFQNFNVSLIRKDSVETSKDFPDKFFDYIYIDGGHDYDIVKADLNAWYPKVKDFGVLGGHDSMYDDVTKAVVEFTSNKNITLHFVNGLRRGNVQPALNDFEDWWILKVPETQNYGIINTAPYGKS